MALVLGTNCGFCAAAPSADPAATPLGAVDGYKLAIEHLAPTGDYKVTEIGWYQTEADNASTDFDVAIYSDDAGNARPNVPLAGGNVGDTIPANTAGWAVTDGLSISLTSNTDHWIAIGVEGSNPANESDYNGSGGKMVFESGWSTPLPNPWGATSTLRNWLVAIYAKYEAAAAGLSIPIARRRDR